MARQPHFPLPLPKGWPRRVRAAAIHAIALARLALTTARGQARETSLQTARSCLLSPRLRPLRYLHDRWDSYPAGTTFTGAGLSPAGTTNLSRHTWTTTPDIGAY